MLKAVPSGARGAHREAAVIGPKPAADAPGTGTTGAPRYKDSLYGYPSRESPKDSAFGDENSSDVGSLVQEPSDMAASEAFSPRALGSVPEDVQSRSQRGPLLGMVPRAWSGKEKEKGTSPAAQALARRSRPRRSSSQGELVEGWKGLRLEVDGEGDSRRDRGPLSLNMGSVASSVLSSSEEALVTGPLSSSPLQVTRPRGSLRGLFQTPSFGSRGVADGGFLIRGRSGKWGSTNEVAAAVASDAVLIARLRAKKEALEAEKAELQALLDCRERERQMTRKEQTELEQQQESVGHPVQQFTKRDVEQHQEGQASDQHRMTDGKQEGKHIISGERGGTERVEQPPLDGALRGEDRACDGERMPCEQERLGTSRKFDEEGLAVDVKREDGVGSRARDAQLRHMQEAGELRVQISALMDERDALVEDHQAEVGALQAEVETLRREKEEWADTRRELAGLQMKLAELQQEQQRAVEDTEHKARESVRLRARIEGLVAERDAALLKASELEAQKAALQERLHALSLEAAVNANTSREMAYDRRELALQGTKLQSELRRAKEEIGVLVESRKGLECSNWLALVLDNWTGGLCQPKH